jgi:HAD superfamily hydrolase (TIGR01509 family)
VIDRFDLVIFDCDGVLVDSERLSIRIDTLFLDRVGWPMTEQEVIDRFVGRSDADMRADIEERIGGPIPAEIDREFDRLYRDTFDAELKPIDGIVDALDEIAATGIPICVASSGGHAKIRRSLELTGLTGYFDDRIFSSADVARGKPAPDLFLHAADRMGASPGRCAVVEDSAFGVAAAIGAGMRAFAYAGGVTTADRLARPGVVVFEEMRDLPVLLEVSRLGS